MSSHAHVKNVTLFEKMDSRGYEEIFKFQHNFMFSQLIANVCNKNGLRISLIRFKTFILVSFPAKILHVEITKNTIFSIVTLCTMTFGENKCDIRTRVEKLSWEENKIESSNSYFNMSIVNSFGKT